MKRFAYYLLATLVAVTPEFLIDWLKIDEIVILTLKDLRRIKNA